MEIKAGDLLIPNNSYDPDSNTFEYHTVLKVKGSGIIGDTSIGTGSLYSSQQIQRAKTRDIIYIWDGEFMRKTSIEEVEQMYSEAIKPNDIRHIGKFKDIPLTYIKTKL